MPYIRAFEVAISYTMYNLAPVVRYHVQVCGTTPCMLRGSDDVFRACSDMGLRKGATTADGLFTLTAVEYFGHCAHAPLIQINVTNFEAVIYQKPNTPPTPLPYSAQHQAGLRRCGPRLLAQRAEEGRDDG